MWGLLAHEYNTETVYRTRLEAGYLRVPPTHGYGPETIRTKNRMWAVRSTY